MLSSYIEDILVAFELQVQIGSVQVQWQDLTPLSSLANAVNQGKTFTKAQSNYVLRLLTKYQNTAKSAGMDYQLHLQNPQWRQQFRILDTSRRVFIETDTEGYPQICLKFPFDFKKTFDTRFSDVMSGFGTKSWDQERRIRIIPLSSINLIALNEFVTEHGFEIDNTFLEVVAVIEEAWDQQDNIIPYSQITPSGVEIVNAAANAQEFWQQYSHLPAGEQCFLAKSMAYPVRLGRLPETPFEKIITSTDNHFWLKNVEDFFKVYKELTTGVVCVLLDRSTDYKKWIEGFANAADQQEVDRKDIKVCFRKTDDKEFNSWIKDQGIGGTVDTGRIFIFENKPAKWLFTGDKDVKIIATNNLYPNTNTISQLWMEGHPCVIYLSDIKPSTKKVSKLVEV